MKIPPDTSLIQMVRLLNRAGYISKESEEYVIHVPKLVHRAAVRQRNLKKALKIAESGQSATLSRPDLKTQLRGPRKRVLSLLDLLTYFKSQFKIATGQKYASKGNDWAALRIAILKWGIKTVTKEVPKFLFVEMTDETLQEPNIGNFFKYLLAQEKLGNLKPE